MQQIEKVDVENRSFDWKLILEPKDEFFIRSGYEKMYRDEESVYYQKASG